MGWWKIDNQENGGIDFGFKKDQLLQNAIPNVDNSTNNYNGDIPADIFDELIEQVIHIWIEEFATIPCFIDIRTFFEIHFLKNEKRATVKNEVDSREYKKFLERAKIKVEEVIVELNSLYQETWKREMNPIEANSILNFCFSANTQKIISWKMSYNLTFRQLEIAMRKKPRKRLILEKSKKKLR